MKISYSVVLYNQEKTEVQALVENILKTFPYNEDEIELYLINNSPENEALNQCLKKLSSDYRIHVIKASRNRGFGAGHNLAIKKITSSYHFIVNPDIFIPNSAQIKNLILFIQQSRAVLVAPKITFPNGEIQPLIKRNPTVFDMGIRFLAPNFNVRRQRHFVYLDEGYDHQFEASNFPGSFLLLDTVALKDVGGFDERYFLYMEDSDLSRSLSLKGKTLYTPSATIVHDWQRANKGSFKGIFEMIKSMVKYFNKWGWQLW